MKLIKQVKLLATRQIEQTQESDTSSLAHTFLVIYDNDTREIVEYVEGSPEFNEIITHIDNEPAEVREETKHKSKGHMLVSSLIAIMLLAILVFQILSYNLQKADKVIEESWEDKFSISFANEKTYKYLDAVEFTITNVTNKTYYRIYSVITVTTSRGDSISLEEYTATEIKPKETALEVILNEDIEKELRKNDIWAPYYHVEVVHLKYDTTY